MKNIYASNKLFKFLQGNKETSTFLTFNLLIIKEVSISKDNHLCSCSSVESFSLILLNSVNFVREVIFHCELNSEFY